MTLTFEYNRISDKKNFTYTGTYISLIHILPARAVLYLTCLKPLFELSLKSKIENSFQEEQAIFFFTFYSTFYYSEIFSRRRQFKNKILAPHQAFLA